MNASNGRINFQYKFFLKKMGTKFSQENLMNKKMDTLINSSWPA